MTNSALPPEAGEPVGTTPEAIRRLVQLVEENGLSELFFEAGDTRIVLRTAAFAASPAPITVTAMPTAAADASPDSFPKPGVAEPEPLPDDSPESGTALPVEAPIMGVFYRSASQGAPPLVEVGDEVTEGQVIGLIEAMKVFSEIPSPAAGRVVEIPARNGALVQPGDALILLETD